MSVEESLEFARQNVGEKGDCVTDKKNVVLHVEKARNNIGCKVLVPRILIYLMNLGNVSGLESCNGGLDLSWCVVSNKGHVHGKKESIK